MQPYDYLMLMVLVGLTLYGYSKGMAWQIAYVASFVVSYFVALRFADRIAPVFGDAAPFNKFLAMLAIYIGSSLCIWIVFRYVRGVIDRVRLESFDHQMGALIGFARGVLWCVGITFFAVGLLPETQKQQIIGSRSGRYIAVLLDKTDSMVPPEIHEVIGPYIHKIEERLSPGPGGYQAGEAPHGATAGSFGWPSQPQQQPNNAGGWPAAQQPAAGPFGWPQQTPQQPAQTSAPQPNFAWPVSVQQQQPAPSQPAPQQGGWPTSPGGGW